MFFNLLGRIGLNSKPLEEGLDRAEKKAVSFADRVEKKVGKKLDKAFGVGLITGAVIGQVHQFMDLFKAGSEKAKGVQELMDKYKLGAESVQALAMAAKEAGVPVEEFIKKVGESGHIEATIARIRELRKQVTLSGEDIENYGQKNTFKERLEENATKFDAWSFRKVSDFLTTRFRVNEMVGQGMTAESAEAQAKAELAEQKRQEGFNRNVQADVDDARIRKLFQGAADSQANSPNRQTSDRSAHLNSLQSIGAYAGVPGDIMLREQQQTNQILQRIESLSREQIRALNSKGNLFL